MKLSSLRKASWVLVAGIMAAACGSKASVESKSHALQEVTVQGHVTQGDGSAVSGATVRICEQNAKNCTYQASSAADGTYSIGLPAGVYDVFVDPPTGSGLLLRMMTGQTFQNSSTTFDIILVGPGDRTVSGRVIDRDGKGLPGVYVGFQGLSQTGASTDENGSYSAKVVDGSYTVSLQHFAGTDTVASAIANTEFHIEGYAVSVAGDTTFDIPVPSLVLSGTVLDGTSVPVAGALVNVPGYWQINTANTGVDGGVGRLTGVLKGTTNSDDNGKFSLFVLPGAGQITASVANGPNALSQLVLTQDKDITLQFLAQMQGKVSDRTGKGIANAHVTLNGQGGAFPTVTDPSGNYAISLPPGPYTVDVDATIVSSMPPDSGAPFPQSSQIQISGYPLTVAGDTVYVIVLPTRVLSGRVQDVEGNPVPMAMTTLYQWTASEPSPSDGGALTIKVTAGGYTDADGKFSYLILPGAGKLQASVQNPLTYKNVELQVTDDTDITVSFDPILSGKITDRTGVGLPSLGIMLTVSGQDSSFNDAIIGTTDSSGDYRISVPPGSYDRRLTGTIYRLVALHSVPVPPDAGSGTDAGSGSGSGSMPVADYTYVNLMLPTLTMSTNTQFNLSLQTRFLTGSVLDVDGNPLPGGYVRSAPWAIDHPSVTADTSMMDAVSLAAADGKIKLVMLPGSGKLRVFPPTGTGLAAAMTDSITLTDDTLVTLPRLGFAKRTSTESVAAGGSLSTDSGQVGATATEPVETSVELPPGVSGTVTITQDSITTAPPSGWDFRTQEVTIQAPDGTPTNPLVLTFRLDGSRLRPGESASSIHIFRNGKLVPSCFDSTVSNRVASPDPCVKPQVMMDNDITFVVMTSKASSWNFGSEHSNGAAGSGGGGGVYPNPNGGGEAGASGGSGTGGNGGVVGTQGAGGQAGAGGTTIPIGVSTSAAGATATGMGGTSGAGGSRGVTDLDGGSEDGPVSSVLDADDTQTPDAAEVDAAEDSKASIDAAPVRVVDAAIASDAGDAGFTKIDAPLVDAGDASADSTVDSGDSGSSKSGCSCTIGAHNASNRLTGLWIVSLGCLACLIRRKRRRG
jgi:protocatechuate 3,4-dioxygenase beta subunit